MCSEEQVVDTENNLIKEIVEKAKSNPFVQTVDIIFGLLEKKGDDDENRTNEKTG